MAEPGSCDSHPIDADVETTVRVVRAIFQHSRVLYVALKPPTPGAAPYCRGVVFTADGLSVRMVVGRDSDLYRDLTPDGRAAFAVGDFETLEGDAYGEGSIADAGGATPLIPDLVSKYSWIEIPTTTGAARCVALEPDVLTWRRVLAGSTVLETTIRRDHVAWSVAATRVKAPR